MELVWLLVCFCLPLVHLADSVRGRTNVTDPGEPRETGDQDGEEQYYEWSFWSPCSRSCGIGVRFRGKRCLREDKSLCKKFSRQYQACNTQSCSFGAKNFRDVQCSRYDDRKIINGKAVKWIAHHQGWSKCLLYCRPEAHALFYYFGRAIDGTQCAKEPHSVCVYGKCSPMGCDGILNSPVRLDKCRVCGGNNTTCERNKGDLKKTPTSREKFEGYAQLMTIPKGSTSVTITETTHNYIALKNAAGEYILNGNRILNWPRMFKAGTTEVKYERKRGEKIEMLKILGPTSEEVTVMTMLMWGQPHIKYDYWQLPDDTQAVVGRFPGIGSDHDSGNTAVHKIEKENSNQGGVIWGKWTICTVSCGGGFKIRARKCGFALKSVCDGSETETATCNEMPCKMMKASWSTWGPWKGCSATCGGGAQMRSRHCKHGDKNNVKLGCSGKKFELRLCNTSPCPTRNKSLIKPSWSEWSLWTKCSATCGAGTQMRFRHCKHGGKLGCSGTKFEQRVCNTPPCPTTNGKPTTHAQLVTTTTPINVNPDGTRDASSSPPSVITTANTIKTRSTHSQPVSSTTGSAPQVTITTAASTAAVPPISFPLSTKEKQTASTSPTSLPINKTESTKSIVTTTESTTMTSPVKIATSTEAQKLSKTTLSPSITASLIKKSPEAETTTVTSTTEKHIVSGLPTSKTLTPRTNKKSTRRESGPVDPVTKSTTSDMSVLDSMTSAAKQTTDTTLGPTESGTNEPVSTKTSESPKEAAAKTTTSPTHITTRIKKIPTTSPKRTAVTTEKPSPTSTELLDTTISVLEEESLITTRGPDAKPATSSKRDSVESTQTTPAVGTDDVVLNRKTTVRTEQTVKSAAIVNTKDASVSTPPVGVVADESTVGSATQSPVSTSGLQATSRARLKSTTSQPTTSSPSVSQSTTSASSNSTTSASSRSPSTTSASSKSTASASFRSPSTTSASSKSTTTAPSKSPSTTSPSSTSTTSASSRSPSTTSVSSKSTTTAPSKNPSTTSASSKSTTTAPSKSPSTTSPSSTSTTSASSRSPSTTSVSSKSTTTAPSKSPSTTSPSSTSTTSASSRSPSTTSVSSKSTMLSTSGSPSTTVAAVIDTSSFTSSVALDGTTVSSSEEQKPITTQRQMSSTPTTTFINTVQTSASDVQKTTTRWRTTTAKPTTAKATTVNDTAPWSTVSSTTSSKITTLKMASSTADESLTKASSVIKRISKEYSLSQTTAAPRSTTRSASSTTKSETTAAKISPSLSTVISTQPQTTKPRLKIVSTSTSTPNVITIKESTLRPRTSTPRPKTTTAMGTTSKLKPTTLTKQTTSLEIKSTTLKPETTTSKPTTSAVQTSLLPSSAPTLIPTTRVVTSAGPTEFQCPPCKVSKKRNKSYCKSDYVLKVRVRKENFNESTGVTVYRVNVKHVFATKVPVDRKADVWVFDRCRCPRLNPNTDYLIMGSLAPAANGNGGTERLALSRDNYVKLWKRGMGRKIQHLRGSCVAGGRRRI